MKSSPDTVRQHTRSLLIGVCMGLFLVITFAGGFFLRDFLDIPPARAFSDESSDAMGYPLLDEVQILLDEVYLRDQKSYTDRQYAAIRGVLAALEDPNTFFIEPVVAQSEADTLAGTYGGIGVLLRRNEAGQFILSPYPDSPAMLAGISEGDVLVAINGQAIQADEQPDSIDQRMRGEVKDGNGIEIQVLKLNNDETLTVFIEFQVINVPSVLWRQMSEDDRLGYVQILRFTNRTPEELGRALSELQRSGIQGLILDLRNNTGGLLQESVMVSSAFLSDGVVIYERSQDEEKSLDVSSEITEGLDEEIPLVILSNGRTASAAEVVAGALQTRGRGIIIGQQTYGKGTVQQIFALSDGSSVHITSSEWLMPDKTPIDGTGLTPDIVMIPDENGRDVESGEALRYLQSILGENNE